MLKATPNAEEQRVALLSASPQRSVPSPPTGADVRYRSSDGRILIASLDSTKLKHLDPQWQRVAELGTPASFKKVFNAQRLVNALDNTQNPVLNAYLTVDPALAPQSKEAIKAALRRVGVDAQTVSGEIVTVRIPAQAVGAAAALNWVQAIELASTVRLR